VNTHRAILFADVRDSTGITEQLGDVVSRDLIGTLLDELAQTTRAHHGTVVKTIGDEVMSAFDNPRDASWAAIQMQRDLLVRPPVDGIRPQIGIGFNAGAVVVAGGDLFGDVVIVAARLVANAVAGQILTTGPTLDAIADSGILARSLGHHIVKGRDEPVDLREILWRGETSQLTTLGPRLEQAPRATLALRLGEQSAHTTGDSTEPIVLGRSPDCTLVVPGTAASRKHAKVTARGGRFYLLDQSTNGTFVRQSDGREIVVHRDEILLTGSGFIRLGEPTTEAGPLDIAFETAIEG
jgi:adenylate cyclase